MFFSLLDKCTSEFRFYMYCRNLCFPSEFLIFIKSFKMYICNFCQYFISNGLCISPWICNIFLKKFLKKENMRKEALNRRSKYKKVIKSDYIALLFTHYCNQVIHQWSVSLLNYKIWFFHLTVAWLTFWKSIKYLLSRVLSKLLYQ